MIELFIVTEKGNFILRRNDAKYSVLHEETLIYTGEITQMETFYLELMNSDVIPEKFKQALHSYMMDFFPIVLLSAYIRTCVALAEVDEECYRKNAQFAISIYMRAQLVNKSVSVTKLLEPIEVFYLFRENRVLPEKQAYALELFEKILTDTEVSIDIFDKAITFIMEEIISLYESREEHSENNENSIK